MSKNTQIETVKNCEVGRTVSRVVLIRAHANLVNHRRSNY